MIRMSSAGCSQNTIARNIQALPAPPGSPSSRKPRTASGAWTSVVASPSCFAAIESLGSSMFSRGVSSALASAASTSTARHRMPRCRTLSSNDRSGRSGANSSIARSSGIRSICTGSSTLSDSITAQLACTDPATAPRQRIALGTLQHRRPAGCPMSGKAIADDTVTPRQSARRAGCDVGPDLSPLASRYVPLEIYRRPRAASVMSA